MHLAALVAIPYSYHSPDTYVDTNIKGTLIILQAARRLGVKKVVHTSTSEVYGTAQYTPIDEEHPLQGQSPYMQLPRLVLIKWPWPSIDLLIRLLPSSVLLILMDPANRRGQ